jgi:hypothetical protein
MEYSLLKFFMFAKKIPKALSLNLLNLIFFIIFIIELSFESRKATVFILP